MAPFLKKERKQIEATLFDLDYAARVEIKCTAFMLLLTVFLAHACKEGSDISADSQRLNLMRDEVILRKVNDADGMSLDSIQL